MFRHDHEVLDFVDNLRENTKALKDFMSTLGDTLSRNKQGCFLSRTQHHTDELLN